jgi:UDP-glucose 4-epimerase
LGFEGAFRLIFGSGTGYIGSFTALALLEAGYKVVVVDNLYNSSQEVLNRIELICGRKPDFYNVDVTDEVAFDKVFAARPDIDSVIHFAALKVSCNCSGCTDLLWCISPSALIV